MVTSLWAFVYLIEKNGTSTHKIHKEGCSDLLFGMPCSTHLQVSTGVIWKP